jgi:hypothetical protein
MDYYHQTPTHPVNYYNYSYSTSDWVSKYNKAMFPVFTIQTIVKAILLFLIFKLWG